MSQFDVCVCEYFNKNTKLEKSVHTQKNTRTFLLRPLCRKYGKRLIRTHTIAHNKLHQPALSTQCFFCIVFNVLKYLTRINF